MEAVSSDDGGQRIKSERRKYGIREEEEAANEEGTERKSRDRISPRRNFCFFALDSFCSLSLRRDRRVKRGRVQKKKREQRDRERDRTR